LNYDEKYDASVENTIKQKMIDRFGTIANILTDEAKQTWMSDQDMLMLLEKKDVDKNEYEFGIYIKKCEFECTKDEQILKDKYNEHIKEIDYTQYKINEFTTNEKLFELGINMIKKSKAKNENIPLLLKLLEKLRDVENEKKFDFQDKIVLEEKGIEHLVNDYNLKSVTELEQIVNL
jgi:hypothetical protein